MQRPGGDSGTGWKLHILRQLGHRDRQQHSAYRELVQSYNKLLEKSTFLKDLTEKIQSEPPPTSPGSHHDARSQSEAVAESGDIPALQKEMSAVQSANGELAFEACELKKQVQERDDQLKEQSTRVANLLDLAEGHQLQRQCLEEEVVLVVCANAELKERYDHLLSQRRLVEERLQETEVEQREILEDMTKKKALQAAQQNDLNERRKEEMWRRMLRKALRKTVSAEGDFVSNQSDDSHDTRSLEMSGSVELEKPLARQTRSQSLIAISPSRVLGVLKNFFDFRKEQPEFVGEDSWYRPSSVCVLCSLPTRALYSKEIHDSEIHAVRFSPNAKLVATGGADRLVKLWDVVGGQLQSHQVLEGSNGGITSIEFDAWGVQLLAASFDCSAHLWRLDTRSKESLTGHSKKVTAARFKMSPYRAVTCSMDRTIREWDLHKLACIRCVQVSSYCSDVVCSESYLVSGHHDKKIRFWDSRSERCIREVTLEEKVTSLYMDQDQIQMLSCSRDDTLSLIDMRMAHILRVFRADGFKCGCDWTKAILSPDTGYVMAGSADGTIFVWNAHTGALERSLNGEHSTSVNAVAWSMSGEYVVSVDRGRKAVLWSEY
ncbi:protein Atg16l2 [Hyperolius riggenbachi]|uniref:protein Atg16l2 n=1 Tax=Hyperolius riggenbachi TaxID=752182 RepID=UPI0035A35740